MRTHGKKFRKAAEKRDIVKSYAPKQALDIVKSAAFAPVVPMSMPSK